MAVVAQDWQGAAYACRFRALRILVRRFGRDNTFLLTLFAAPVSFHDWVLSIRARKPNESPDGGKRDREEKRSHWDYVICSEIYKRMKGGQSKMEAIAAVKEDYRTGAPFPSDGLLPPLNRPRRGLPGPYAIEKWMKRFRRDAKLRNYINPYAAFRAGVIVTREPELTRSDIPSRGRPKKNR